MDQELLYSRIASNFFGRPLLLRPQEAEMIGSFLRMRMEGQRAPDASRYVGEEQIETTSDGRKRWKGYRREGNVGIVSIIGELVNRGAWLGASSGLTSYEGIAQQMRQAAADRDVSDIVLDMQSPGGEAIGMAETARLIRAISREKPVTAVVNGMAASAGFGLASGASEIVVTESAITGSIGVVLVHFDQSRRLDAMGVKATIIHAGALKAVGNQYGPLSRDDLAVLQAEVDRFMSGFVRVVADHRGISEQAIRDLEAGIFIGEDAISAGLADRVGTFDSVISDLSRAQGGRTTSLKRRLSMSEQTGAPAAETAGISQETHDNALAKAHAKSHAEGMRAGAEAERARIGAIIAAEGIKGNAARLGAALDLAAKAPGMSADDVVAFATANIPDAADPTAHQNQAPDASLGNRQADDTLGQAGASADAGKPEKAKLPSAAEIYKNRAA